MEAERCKTINGIDLYTYGVPTMVFTKDHELTVYLDENDNDKIVFCMFQSILGNAFNKYSHLLKDQKVKDLRIWTMGKHDVSYTYDLTSIDLDNLELLFIDVQKTDEIVIQSDQNISKLKQLFIRGPKPKNFLNLPIFSNICYLDMQDAKGKDSLELIKKCAYLKDFRVYGLKQDDLTVFSEHKYFKRLFVSQSTIKNLNGISQIDNLETLIIVSTRSLTNVDELFRAKKLKNIMFSKYRKITDWDFLAQKQDWNAISLEVAENIDFLQKLLNLKHFYCEKVLNADDKKEKWFRLGDGASVFYEEVG